MREEYKMLYSKLIRPIIAYRSFLLLLFFIWPYQSLANNVIDNKKISIFSIKIGERGACGAFYYRGYLYTAAHCITGKKQLVLYDWLGNYVGPLDPNQFEIDHRYIDGKKQFDQARAIFNLSVKKFVELSSVHDYFFIYSWFPDIGWGVSYSDLKTVALERIRSGYTFNVEDGKICQGHSGLPVISKRKNKYYIVGIMVGGNIDKVDNCGKFVVISDIDGFFDR